MHSLIDNSLEKDYVAYGHYGTEVRIPVKAIQLRLRAERIAKLRQKRETRKSNIFYRDQLQKQLDEMTTEHECRWLVENQIKRINALLSREVE